MTDKNLEIFLAVYFSDFGRLSELIVEKNDLLLPVELEWNNAVFSVLDILQMTLDVWNNDNREHLSENKWHLYSPQ